MTILDWVLIGIYLVGTTLLGGWLSGRQSTLREFFLAGRKLPWYAVCGSIIATEISAITFVAVPAITYQLTGNFTYLMLAVGTILARFIIGYVFVPLYYRREIYSPYEYMGAQLGPGVNQITSGIFVLGAILAQGVRVYITAVVLVLVLGIDQWLLARWAGTEAEMAEVAFYWGMVICIWAIVAVAVLWTWMGGIATVIWTDVIQFCIFVFGGLLAMFWVIHSLRPEVGLGFWGTWHWIATAAQEVVGPDGQVVNKLRVWNFSLHPQLEFTLWAGLFGGTLLTMASHGVDQMLAQRMFCCRGPRQARWAIIGSSAGVLLTVLMLWVGVGLFFYYQTHTLSPDDQALVARERNVIFPMFILRVLPPGLTGVLIAGIFAAAITSLDSALAALAQTSITSFYQPLIRPQASERHYLLVSRGMVMVWGAALVVMAIACISIAQDERYKDLINLALSMVTYTYGALLGILLMAILPFKRDGRGLYWAVPLSIVSIYALSWKGPVVNVVMCLTTVILGWSVLIVFKKWPKYLVVGLGLGLMWLLGSLHERQILDPSGTKLVNFSLAYPWNILIGTLITLVVGVLLGRRREVQPEDVSSGVA